MRVLIRDAETGQIALVEAIEIGFYTDEDIPTLRRGIYVDGHEGIEYTCDLETFDTDAEDIVKQALYDGFADLSSYNFEYSNSCEDMEEVDGDEEECY